MATKNHLKDIIDKYEYFDTHAHLNEFPLLNNLDFYIQDCLNYSVLICNAGTNEKTSREGIKQAKQYDNVFTLIGFHPDEIRNLSVQQCADIIENLYLQNKDYILGIGEIGLDYTSDVDHELQKQVFIKMLDLAKKYNLPVQLHIRNAFNDALKIIKKYKDSLTITIHCFSLGINELKQYLKLKCFISLNGIITFQKKNQDLLSAVSFIPLNRILLETDSPFLTPVPYRGQTNCPSNVRFVFKRLIQLLNINEINLKKQLRINALKAFKII